MTKFHKGFIVNMQYANIFVSEFITFAWDLTIVHDGHGNRSDDQDDINVD